LISGIRFLHIPKTAGSTFDECLFLQYFWSYLLRRQFVFSGNIEADRERWDGLSAARRQRVRTFTGHAPRVTGCAEIDAVPTVVLLRHPVQRVKSFCQHVSEGKSPQIYCGEKHGAFELDALLESGRIQLNNFQSRCVLGQASYQLERAAPGELARRAMAQLDSEFACFGLTEDFDRSLLLFRRVLGWKKWPLYRSRNIGDTRSRVKFEARHIARIEELNRIDLAFYELASAAFYRQLSAFGPDIEEQLPLFRSALAKSGIRFAAMDMARALGRVARATQAGSPRAASSR
jgi:hypothetical protein